MMHSIGNSLWLIHISWPILFTLKINTKICKLTTAWGAAAEPVRIFTVTQTVNKAAKLMHIIYTTSHDHLFLDNVRLGEVSPFLQKDRKATSLNIYSSHFKCLYIQTIQVPWRWWAIPRGYVVAWPQWCWARWHNTYLRQCHGKPSDPKNPNATHENIFCWCISISTYNES